MTGCGLIVNWNQNPVMTGSGLIVGLVISFGNFIGLFVTSIIIVVRHHPMIFITIIIHRHYLYHHLCSSSCHDFLIIIVRHHYLHHHLWSSSCHDFRHHHCSSPLSSSSLLFVVIYSIIIVLIHNFGCVRIIQISKFSHVNFHVFLPKFDYFSCIFNTFYLHFSINF